MTDYKEENDKLIKVPPQTHQQIKMLAAKETRQMREIVATAFEFYMKNRSKKSGELLK